MSEHRDSCERDAGVTLRFTDDGMAIWLPWNGTSAQLRDIAKSLSQCADSISAQEEREHARGADVLEFAR